MPVGNVVTVKKMKAKHFAFGIGLIALILLTSGVMADSDTGIEYEYQNGISVLTIDDVEIKVNTFGNVPIFHYNKAAGLNYTVLFKQLVEYQDLNEDGVFQYNENLAGSPIFSLMSVKWTFSGFEVEEEAGITTAVHFNFTSSQIMGVFQPDLEIVITAHLYLEGQEIDGYELEAGELKFDLYISGWDWAEVDSFLAVRFDITPSEGAQFRNTHGQPVDTGVNSTNLEKKAQLVENKMKQQFNISAANEVGYFGFANQSQIKTLAENQYRHSNVNASYSSNGAGTLQVFLSFEHFDELIYDPSIGSYTIDDETEGTPLSIIAAIAPLVVFAVLRKRKEN